MTPQAYLQALMKRWWLIVGLALLASCIGFTAAKMTTPMYRSTATSYATLSQAGSISELVQGSTYTQSLMQSFALLATTPTVLDPVIDDLDLQITPTVLAKTITATVPLNSFLIEIQATSPDPHEAAAIADTVAAQLATAVQWLAPSTPEGSATVRLEMVAGAITPTDPYKPNTRLEVLIWGLGGAALGVIAALVWALTDTRVRRETDIDLAGKIPVLGSVPWQRKPSRDGISNPSVNEAFRRVRTNLAFIDAERHTNAVVITSPSAGEGKTTSTLELASSLAEVHSRVLVIDADLRKPSVATRTGVLPDAGLTNVLIGQATLGETVQAWHNIDILASGPTPPNPAQLIESISMTDLIEDAKQRYDYVVIDSPPLLPVIDASVLAKKVGGALIVVRAGRTRRAQLAQGLQTLRAIDAAALGGILTGTEQVESYYGTQTEERSYYRTPHTERSYDRPHRAQR